MGALHRRPPSSQSSGYSRTSCCYCGSSGARAAMGSLRGKASVLRRLICLMKLDRVFGWKIVQLHLWATSFHNRAGSRLGPGMAPMQRCRWPARSGLPGKGALAVRTAALSRLDGTVSDRDTLTSSHFRIRHLWPPTNRLMAQCFKSIFPPFIIIFSNLF